MARSKRLNQLEENGIIIESLVFGNIVINPVPFFKQHTYDLVILAVKSHQTEEALLALSNCVRKDTIILSLQNGIDTGSAIVKHINRDNVILSVINGGFFIDYRGIVQHLFGGRLILGTCENEIKNNVKIILELFNRAHIECEVAADIREALWKKSLWNSAFSPLSVLLKKTCGQLMESKIIRNVMNVLVDEVIAAANVEDIKFNCDEIAEVFYLEEAMKSYKAILLQDIEALKIPEIDGLLLPIIKRLEKIGDNKSYHRLLYDILNDKYGKFYIYTPRIAADTIVINKNKEVLLIKRKNPPYGWAIPGGFVDYNEKVEDAAKREIFEETGIILKSVTLFGVYSNPSRDYRGHTVSVVYYSFSEDCPHAGDDAKEVCYFPFNNLPTLAFDHCIILTEFANKIFNTL